MPTIKLNLDIIEDSLQDLLTKCGNDIKGCHKEIDGSYNIYVQLNKAMKVLKVYFGDATEAARYYNSIMR